jgi:hypothetical protein
MCPLGESDKSLAANGKYRRTVDCSLFLLSDDPCDTVCGPLGLVGVPDTVLLLKIYQAVNGN